jgi:hypothetical protein
MLFYLLAYRPFTSKIINVLEIYNEISILILTYILWEFSDFVPSSTMRYKIGWFYSAVLVLNIAVNCTTTLYITCINPCIVRKIRLWLLKRKLRRAIKKELMKKKMENNSRFKGKSSYSDDAHFKKPRANRKNLEITIIKEDLVRESIPTQPAGMVNETIENLLVKPHKNYPY